MCLFKVFYFTFFKANIPGFLPLNAWALFCFSGGGSYVSFSMCFHCSKYSGGIQEAEAGYLWVAHLSSRTTRPRNFLTWQWLCQKPLITSLDLSSHSIKQYSHYASRRAEPNTLLLLEFSILVGSREGRGLPPTWGRATGDSGWLVT